MTRVSLLGGGKMGEALLAGMLDGGYEPADLCVAEADPDRRRHLESTFVGVRVVPASSWALPDADVVIVAVKPGDVAEALGGSIDGLANDALVLSIAAGVTIRELEALVPGRPVVRAMPNTPALLRSGASAIAGGSNSTVVHIALASRLLGAVGTVVEVPEDQLDAVTGLSGSGPAYVFLVAEALIEAGVLAGLSRDVSIGLVTQTLLGSARLLAEGDSTAEQLRAAVTSPGGTTAAGLRALEAHGIRAALLEAVMAATQRSRELGAP